MAKYEKFSGGRIKTVVLMVIGLLLALTLPAQAAAPPEKTVRVYWLRPYDVQYDQRYPDGIAKLMREAQRYYQQELGKTFQVNNVEVVTGDHNRSWYENTTNGGDRYL